MTGFIQTGDIHIGECRTLDGYLERHKSILKQILAVAVDRALPLVIAGDIFHTRKTTHAEKFLADWWFGEIERSKTPTIVITGNHDHLYDNITQLDGYTHMPFQYVHFVTWDVKSIVFGDTQFICVPWRNYSTEEMAKAVKEKILSARTKYRVVVAHECLLNAVFDNGSFAPKGTKLPNLPEIDYWALADIHSFQKTNLNNGFYCGSPMQFVFGDQPRKGVLAVNLDKTDSPEFIPLSFKPLRIVSSVEEITEDAYYMVRGDFQAVLDANQHKDVVKTDWAASSEVIEYQKIGLIDGLPEYLATKSIGDEYQAKAVTWVNQLLNVLAG